ncbi:MAG: hypothetical protein LIP77_03310, partial [Planctomycetes bacterium]|nr:hypothetical protein [Planctomycetota bacterium]
MVHDAPFYYGSAENKLNSKGQVAIPARFRTVVPDEDGARNYVLVRGEPSCLYLYTHRQFGRIKDNARKVAEESGDSGFYRNFMAQACPVDIDTQGRFVLPPAYMKMVGITGPTILFIGVDDRIELWEPSA